MPVFFAEDLERLAAAFFEAAGASPREGSIVARHLVEANLAGHDSHGLLRMPQYIQAIDSGKVRLGAKAEVLEESEATALIDGGKGFGQVVAREAMSLAMRKARQCGIAAVALRNSYHSGRIASYSKEAAEAGLIAMVMVNAGGGGQLVAPYGGLGRRLATNPISLAAPRRAGPPLVLDIATSVAPEGKIRDFLQKGRLLPSGWIVDAQGKPSTHAKDFYSDPPGALLPLGGSAGYKGFGLGFMIDILAGALSGAGCCRPGWIDPSDGLFIIALELDRFMPRDYFYEQVEVLVRHVKSCPPAPGFQEVYVPGEMEIIEEKRRRAEGIFIDENTWRELEALRARFGAKVAPARSICGLPIDSMAPGLRPAQQPSTHSQHG